MSKLWELLNAEVDTTGIAPVLQVAADGRWEQAQIVPIHGDPAAGLAAVATISATANVLAMEILWPGTMFVGTAWRAEHHDEAGPAAARVFEALKGRPSDGAMTGLTALLGGTPDGEVGAAALGAVNAWLSVGQELLWEKGGTYDRAAVDSALDQRPDLMTCTHPVAVEFPVAGTRYCWVAIFVSTPGDGVHHLDRERLHEVLTAVIG